MVVLDEYKFKLGELTKTLEQANAQMRPEELKTELAGLENQMSAADFWNDVDGANKVTQRVKSIKSKLERLDKLNGNREDIQTLIEMAEEEDDESIIEEIKTELDELDKKVSALRLEMLLKGPYDAYNCVLSLHAGAGGTEAQDWTEMLYRMYSRYCERRGWSVKEIDLLMGDDAGIKSVTFEVDGENAYGYLKAEKGVHRLVRISPFDANARRHTSFSAVEVIPEITDDVDVDIRPEDYEMQVYRSSGAGGQHINKTSSAVRLIHKPTGIVVACQEERSQFQNREKAMNMLASKLYEIEQEKLDAQVSGTRRSQVGMGMRNEKIRTYNFPQDRVTDHRIGLTLHNIQGFMDGDLDGMIDALTNAAQAERLRAGVGEE